MNVLGDGVKDWTAFAKQPDCYENEMPRSCQDLGCLGYKLNGFYLVREDNASKIQTVYCDFSTVNTGSNSGKTRE